MNSNTDRARKDVCDERPGQLYAMDDLESQCRMNGDGAGETTGQCHNALRDVTDANPPQEVSNHDSAPNLRLAIDDELIVEHDHYHGETQ